MRARECRFTSISEGLKLARADDLAVNTMIPYPSPPDQLLLPTLNHDNCGKVTRYRVDPIPRWGR